MRKSGKKFTLSTSGLNSFGFRMLTEGADLKEFQANPVMLWMHSRALRGTRDEVLPLGFWGEIAVEGDRITAVPVFDDKDAFAMAIYHKVENGTIRTCSAGAAPLEFSDDPKHLLPGQTRPTVTRWKLKEGSLTDIGSNPGALAVALYDRDDRLINLSEKTDMATIPALQEAFGLRATGPAKAWDELFRTGELEALRLNDPHRYAKVFRDRFGRLPAGRPNPKQAPAADVAHLAAKTWEELHASGELAGLKINNPVLYSLKFRERFGKLPSNV